jgi:hypothetical protein
MSKANFIPCSLWFSGGTSDRSYRKKPFAESCPEQKPSQSENMAATSIAFSASLQSLRATLQRKARQVSMFHLSWQCSWQLKIECDSVAFTYNEPNHIRRILHRYR